MSAAKNIGRNRNVNDEADVPSGITINSTTSTVIAAANPDRISFRVDNNEADKGAWVKLQAASVDNQKKGIWLKGDKTESAYIMDPDNIYTGEISAIGDSDSFDLYVTEY